MECTRMYVICGETGYIQVVALVSVFTVRSFHVAVVTYEPGDRTVITLCFKRFENATNHPKACWTAFH